MAASMGVYAIAYLSLPGALTAVCVRHILHTAQYLRLKPAAHPFDIGSKYGADYFKRGSLSRFTG